MRCADLWTGPRGYSPLSLTHPQKTAFFGCWLLLLKSVASHPSQSQSLSVYRVGRIRKHKLCEFAALRQVSRVFFIVDKQRTPQGNAGDDPRTKEDSLLTQYLINLTIVNPICQHLS